MKKLKKWLPSLVLIVIISVLSSLPGPVINAAGLGDEKYHINGHFFLFIALCLSFYYSTRKVLLSIIMTATFGIFDELHQMFTPFRSASIFDIWVDILGALTGGILSWKFWQPVSTKLKKLLKK